MGDVTIKISELIGLWAVIYFILGVLIGYLISQIGR